MNPCRAASDSIRSLCCAFFLCIGCCATMLGQASENYTAIQIPIPGYAANSSVKALFQDHIGLLWVGTQEGLFVFDGNNVERFNLERKGADPFSVFSIAADDQQRLWVCTNQGPYVFNSTRNEVIPHDQLGIPEAIIKHLNFSICQGPDKSLLFLSGDQIYQFIKNELRVWTDLPPKLLFTSGSKMFYANKDQSLLIRSAEQRCVFVVPQKGTVRSVLKNASSMLSKLNEDSLLAIVSDRKISPLILKYDKTNQDFSISSPSKDIERVLINPVKKILTRDKNMHPKNLIDWQIFPLRQNLWAVSCSEGLFLVYSAPKLFKSISSSLSNRIRGMTTDRYNNLIYGTYNGLYWHNTQNGQSGLITKEKTIIWNIVATNESRDQFITSGEGLPNKRFFLRSTPMGVFLEDIYIQSDIYSESHAMLKDNKGRGFWYAEGSYNTFHLKLLQSDSFIDRWMLPSLQVSSIRSIVQTDGIWIGSDHGLLYADISTSEDDNIKISNQAIPAVLRKQPINVVQRDKAGNLWIGSRSQGIFYYNTSTHNFIQYTVLDGLADNTVFSIAPANDSTVWIGTGNGLSRLDLKKNWFQNFYTKDGLLGNEFNTAAAHLADNGTLYFGGQNGINFFSPEDFQADTTIFSQYLKISLPTNKGENLNDILYFENQSSIVIKPNTEFVEISFHSGDLVNAQKIRHRYRIEGLMNDWRYINHRDKAILTKLPIGKHTIEVQSLAYRGTWNPVSTYHITVLPPWYKTWWFQDLIVLCVVAILYVSYHFRIRYLRREFELRQQISHDLHDSLGSRIFLLRSMSNRIVNPLSSESERKEQIQRLETISQDVFNNIRDFIWAFDPKQDGITQLFDRMDDFAENYLSPLITSVEISRNIAAKNDLFITPSIKHNLLNVYQEILTNMVKHTLCDRISIQLSAEKRTLQIIVTNYHKGLKGVATAAPAPDQYGKASMLKRLDSINATLTWCLDTEDVQKATITAQV